MDTKALDKNLGIVEADNLKQGVKSSESKEVLSTVESVNAGLNVLGENADLNVTGEISEKNKKIGEQGASASSGGQTTVAAAAPLPSVELMIEQTVKAIEKQLIVKEEQLRKMSRKGSTKPFELNNAVRELRYLNNILYQLKNTARQASDFIVNLWKQYVNKVS